MLILYYLLPSAPTGDGGQLECIQASVRLCPLPSEGDRLGKIERILLPPPPMTFEINFSSSLNFIVPEDPKDINITIARNEQPEKEISKTVSGGDLSKLIESANSGDVIQLEEGKYYTDGLVIDKKLTIKGKEGTVIDGKGTEKPIITLYSGASGATIQDLELTNGNIGIHGYKASNLTLSNLKIYNIGKNELLNDNNQIGINLDHADGLKLTNTSVHDVNRKGIGVADTNGAEIINVNVQSVNLAANHAQSHDTAGIKFFNTNNILLKDSHFEKINANFIWNDTTNATTMDNNNLVNVGAEFLAPSFNKNVNIVGIYNEKSSNSIVRNNKGTTAGNFADFNATEFTTKSMTLEDNNKFSKVEVNTKDYWVNEEAEKLIAVTENPDEANFSLFSEEYNKHLETNKAS